MTNRFLPFYTAISRFRGKGRYFTPTSPPKIKNPASRAVFFVLLGILCGAFGAAKADTETVDNGDGTFTVRVYPEPYVPAAVDIVASDTFGDYETTTGPLRARFREDTSVDYTTGEQTIGLKPSDIWFDTTNTTALVVTSSHSLQPVEGKLDVSNLWGKGIAAKYEARENAVKETLTLEQPFLDTIPLGAKTVEFRWTLDNPGGLKIRHALEGVVLGDFRIEPVEARDAVGRYLPGRTVYQDGEIVGTLDAKWLRGATAPVVVDPTVQSGYADQLLSGTAMIITDGYRNRMWWQFDLPNIWGGTCTAASFFGKCWQVNDSCSVNAFVDDEDSWTESSNATTMYGIPLNEVLDTVSVTTVNTYYEWDITGDSNSGIVELYENSKTVATVILGSPQYSFSGINNVSDTELWLGDGPNQIDLKFYGQFGDSRGYIEVTYTGGSSGSTPPQDPAVGGVLRH